MVYTTTPPKNPKPPTAKDIAALQLIADGKTQQEAATILGITERSFYNRIHRMRWKYRKTSTVHLIAEAVRKEWID